MMILAALGQVLIFGWIVGAERGVKEANRGAELRIPTWVAGMIRYVTPTFLIVMLCFWCYFKGPDRLRMMSPSYQGDAAARAVYSGSVAERFPGLDDKSLATKVTGLLGQDVGIPEDTSSLPDWLQAVAPQAEAARPAAERPAVIARFVFLGVVLVFIVVFVLSDIACRNRIGRSIKAAGDHSLEAAS
jgi:hypothetical protein